MSKIAPGDSLVGAIEDANAAKNALLKIAMKNLHGHERHQRLTLADEKLRQALAKIAVLIVDNKARSW